MFAKRKKGQRGEGKGVVWPDTGTSVPSDDVRDVFGPRPFSAHLSTVGYDYDFHRGVDIGGYNQGDNVYASINGGIIRQHYTHFGWEADIQMDRWVEIDASGSATFTRQGDSYLRVTGDRVGSQDLVTGAARYQSRDVLQPKGDDWLVECVLSASYSSVTGAFGFGIYDPTTDEHATLEYDGADFTIKGAHVSGTMEVDGTTDATAGKVWLRVEWDDSLGTLKWRHSDDGDSWTDITTTGSVYWSGDDAATFNVVLYWKSTDTDAAQETVDIDFLGWIDDQTIGRFGNWMLITDGDRSFMSVHLREISSSLGDYVHAGQLVAHVGTTGFDTTSGRISYPHIHSEYLTSSTYLYNNAYGQNPLRHGVLPRASTLTSLTVNRLDLKLDPGNSGSQALEITASRGANQAFDVNYVIFTGSSGQTSFNFDTRDGLNANNDIPFNNGVYIVPESFDENDDAYIMTVYFHTSSYGDTFTSAAIHDSDGNVLWIEVT